MRFKLVETELFEQHYGDILQGTFIDTDEVNKEIKIYATLSNIEGDEEVENSLRVYAHSYSGLYEASRYALYEIENEYELREIMIKEWYKVFPKEEKKQEEKSDEW